jgi:MerR family transcriptional regulator, copper efflux regulator
MRIGVVAAQANVNEQTLRFYERAGLLRRPARAKNGYRDYPPDTVALVRFIKRAQELGFSLADAGALGELRRAPGRNRLKVRELAQAKLRDVEQKIADLTAIQNALQQLVSSCCSDDGPGCPILEALAADTPQVSVNRVNRTSPKGPTR